MKRATKLEIGVATRSTVPKGSVVSSIKTPKKMMIGKLIHAPYSMTVHVPGREFRLELRTMGKICSVVWNKLGSCLAVTYF